MKNFVYPALALGGLSFAASCVIVTDRPEIDVLWNVSGSSSDPAIADGCETLGASGVEVVTRRQSTGAIEIDVFDCSVGNVVIERRTGDYDLWVNAIDGEDRLMGGSIEEPVYLDTSSTYFEVPELGFQNGEFVAGWELYDDNDGQPRSCSEVGVGGLSILTTLAGDGGTAFDDIFDCPSNATYGDVYTDPLALGDYSVDVTVLDSADDSALGEPEIKQGTLSSHRQREDLGIYEFYFL